MFPAERIKQLREDKEITQKELAKIIHVSEDSVSLYERGLVHPSIQILIELANFFGVSIEYLLGMTDIKIPPEQIQQKLVTRSGVIPIDNLFHLTDEEKEIIGLLIKVFSKK